MAASVYDNMTLDELGKLLNPRQEKFAAGVVAGLSQTEAAVMAGYSLKTAARQGSDLFKNQKVAAYRRALTHAVLERLCLTPEAIALRLVEVLDRCMQKMPVMVWDSVSKSYVESGTWQFDSRGATRVLELLGKNAGMFAERVQVTGHVGSVEDYLLSLPQGRDGGCAAGAG